MEKYIGYHNCFVMTNLLMTLHHLYLEKRITLSNFFFCAFSDAKKKILSPICVGLIIRFTLILGTLVNKPHLCDIIPKQKL